jgi:hypothetical protein
MDRPLVYAGQVPRALDNLNLGEFAMVGLAKLSEALLGTSAVVSQGGFAVTPGSGLSIAVGAGQIYQLQSIEPTTQSALNVNGRQVLKQGIALDAQTLTLAPPTTVGYAQNFLLQVAYQDVPSGSVVLSFQNPTPVLDPSTNTYKYVTYPGPGGNGAASYTILQGGVSVIAKPGTAATAGSQTTPAPDAGYAGLYVVTLAYGATSISSGNISIYSGAPFIPVTLPGVPAGVQSGSWTYAVDTGSTAGSLVSALSPVPASLPDGFELSLKTIRAAAGGDALNLNGFGFLPIRRRGGGTPAAGDWAAGDILILIKSGSTWQVAGLVSSDVTTTIAQGPYAGTRGIAIVSSTQTWPVPSGVYYLKRVRIWGGGGGGGGSFGSSSGGSGGGGGGYAEKFNIAVTPGQQVAVTVGGGGAAGSGSPTNGGAGGTTSFGSFFSATGGGGGYAGNGGIQSTSSGLFGNGVGGDFNVPGANGGFAILIGSSPGSGVGGAATFGGSSPSGNYGTTGNPGNFPGGAANGGSAGGLGGVGGAGLVIIEY